MADNGVMNRPCPAEPPYISGGAWGAGSVEPTVTVVDSGTDGWTTYRLSVQLLGGATNIYSIFGTADAPMSIPAAYQADGVFGASIGGTNPVLWAVSGGESSQFDSWLTVGITGGDFANQLGSIGIAFDDWTDSTPLTVTDGAVFYMDPSQGPSGSAVLATS